MKIFIYISDLYITHDCLDNFYLETKCDECFLCKKILILILKKKILLQQYL